MSQEGLNDSVTFELYNDSLSYSFKIEKIVSGNGADSYFTDLDKAETLYVGDICIYAFEFENKKSCIRFEYDDFKYMIQSEIPLKNMLNTIQTIIITEE